MYGLLTDATFKIFDALQNQVRLVGGCIRDALLNRPISDIDMATPLKPQEVMRLLSEKNIRWIPTGLKHGTITALIANQSFEITTLRTDLKTNGRHALVKYSTSYEQDARRRDFTINALYMDAAGVITDYVGGLKDLHAKIVRFIGDPFKRIQEDYLRILRYFRFWSIIGATPPDPALESIFQKTADHLIHLSTERKRDEFLKLITTPKASQALLLMQKTHVLDKILEKANIPSFQKFVSFFPASNMLERLSVLTDNRMPDELKLSKKQKQFLTDVNRYHLGQDMLKNKLLRTKISPAVFSLLSQKAFINKVLTREQYEQLVHFNPPKFTLTGSDMLLLGFTQGLEIRKALETGRHIWAHMGFPNNFDSIKKQLAQLTLKERNNDKQG